MESPFNNSLEVMQRKVHFYKFQANGNDFILVDNRDRHLPDSRRLISRLCDRHFGVGADGLMLLEETSGYDFEMVFFNSDGRPGEMCGNGGRSLAAFAFLKKIAGRKMQFLAGDGLHLAEIHGTDDAGRVFDVSLKMQDVTEVKILEDGYFLNTGVPHFVRFVNDVESIDVFAEGRRLRNDPRFAPDGTNVNFVEIREDRLFVRTYERGVENETLSCGTGVTASAMVAFLKEGKLFGGIHARGGEFMVTFLRDGQTFRSVWLRGPAEWVFEGIFPVNETDILSAG